MATRPMAYLLCRNRVEDFDRWKRVFDSHARAHRESGLELAGFWRGVDEADDVFFLVEVTDMAKARAFIHDPPAAEAAQESGVLDGEYHFIEKSEGYDRQRPTRR